MIEKIGSSFLYLLIDAPPIVNFKKIIMTTYEIFCEDGRYTGIIYYKDTPIKILINHKTEESCINMCEAYIRHVKIKDNPAKGMSGTFFVNDFDGEVIHAAAKLKKDKEE